MPSFGISVLRSMYKCDTDAELAAACAQKNGYVSVIRYRSSSNVIEHDNFGCCRTVQETANYLRLLGAEVIYPIE